MLELAVTRSISRPSPRPLVLATCLLCQRRAISTTHPRLAGTKPATTKGRFASKTPSASQNATQAAKQPPAIPQQDAVAPAAQEQAPAPVERPLANAPRSYGKRVDNYEPTALARPIGMLKPPRSGENTGIDTRSLRQRRDDLVNYEKHLKRREEL